MAVKLFAAIDIGSFQLEMKIFEISVKNGIKEIDDIRFSLDLGSETYANGKLSGEKVDELCDALNDFTRIMNSYGVTDYKAYGTSAIRETQNTKILLDQIKQRTGFSIDVLSNSEQRFMDYKSIASKTVEFNKMLEKGTVILDVGGGSIQLSLFEKESLITTQNIRLGVLRIQERLQHLNAKMSQLEELVDEIVAAQVSVFKKLFLRDSLVSNLIIVDDYLSPVIQKRKQVIFSEGAFCEFLDGFRGMTLEEIAEYFDISGGQANLLFISAVMLRRILKMTGAEQIWAPGVTLCDGIVYEKAEKSKLVLSEHDFEADILSAAKHISKRYMGSKKRSETLEKIALAVFDSMKKIHGLGKRERLLLQLATILHDCGKYISLVNLGECSYSIIMSSEIIGLSHREREILANVVKYNRVPFEYYDSIVTHTTLEQDSYLIIAKLTAILRLANGLDRSHKEKFQDVKMTLKEDRLIISVNTSADITLEKGLFSGKSRFFEEVFSVKAQIRQRRAF